MNDQPLPKDAANTASAILKFLEKSEREFIEHKKIYSVKKGETADENK